MILAFDLDLDSVKLDQFAKTSRSKVT